MDIVIYQNVRISDKDDENRQPAQLMLLIIKEMSQNWHIYSSSPRAGISMLTLVT